MNYSYNTYREIRQQPAVWLKTLDSILAHKQEIKAFKDKYLNAGYDVVLTGAGTSAYIGDALEPALYTTSFKGNFVARNKIISGLSKCTIIVQSKVKGGALLTGEFTKKEGKALYACPGDFDCEVAGGTNLLLDQGQASPVFIPENLYKVIGLPRTQEPQIAELERSGCNLTQGAKELFFKFKGFRKTFSEIQSELTLATPQLLAILTELEIAGLAESKDNFQFYFNGEP